MKFVGKPCGMCDKGRMLDIQDEVEEDIFVQAGKCDYCGNIAYSGKVMQKIEAMNREKTVERSLIKIGSSLAVSIPAGIVKKLSLKPKEKVRVSIKGNQIIATVAHA
mgnify:FL=1